MPRFYFHIFNDLDVHDSEGQQLDDNDAAHAQAIKECRVLAAESVREGHLDLGHRIEVHDENKEPVLTVTFSDAVRIIGR